MTSVILACIFLSLFGFLWYGVLFSNLQMEAHNFTPADYVGNNPVWYVGGALISLLIAAGLAVMVRLGGVTGATAGFKAGGRAALCFGLPLVAYPFVYSPHHEFALFLAELANILIGWTVAAGLIGALSRPSQVREAVAEPSLV
jgi:hypothetical protein